MFQIHYLARRVRVVGIGQAAGKAGNYIAGKIARCHPFALVNFIAIEADMAFAFAKFSAIKDIEDLVAFRVVGCPVVNQ